MQQLWPHVLSALNTYVINSDATHVAVTGHSLGAGVGTLIAYAAAKYLAAQNSAAMVDAVMFGSPAGARRNTRTLSRLQAYGPRALSSGAHVLPVLRSSCHRLGIMPSRASLTAVGDSTFMADLAATLNARSIAFADDIVTHSESWPAHGRIQPLP